MKKLIIIALFMTVISDNSLACAIQKIRYCLPGVNFVRKVDLMADISDLYGNVELYFNNSAVISNTSYLNGYLSFTKDLVVRKSHSVLQYKNLEFYLNPQKNEKCVMLEVVANSCSDFPHFQSKCSRRKFTANDCKGSDVKMVKCYDIVTTVDISGIQEAPRSLEQVKICAGDAFHEKVVINKFRSERSGSSSEYREIGYNPKCKRDLLQLPEVTNLIERVDKAICNCSYKPDENEIEDFEGIEPGLNITLPFLGSKSSCNCPGDFKLGEKKWTITNQPDQFDI